MRRNAILILMSVELMLNGVNVSLVAFDVYWADAFHAGQSLAIFVITIAAAEIGLGLAILLLLYRVRGTIAIDEAHRAARGRVMTAALAMVLIPALTASCGTCLSEACRAVRQRRLQSPDLRSPSFLRALWPCKNRGASRWSEPASARALLPLGATVVDGLAVTVSLMVCLVSLLVQIYSIGYMADEPRYSSYAAFISLFTAAMLAVVVAGDLLLLVIGWEVMGLCSYLLIGQHWEQEEARSVRGQGLPGHQGR